LSIQGPEFPRKTWTEYSSPSFSTKAPGKGTGLGLFVSRDIVEKFGGKLTVESKLGEGTCFKIRIPDQDRYSDDEPGLE
jgi:two-component system NtrC family sensor kinase